MMQIILILMIFKHLSRSLFGDSSISTSQDDGCKQVFSRTSSVGSVSVSPPPPTIQEEVDIVSQKSGCGCLGKSNRSKVKGGV